MKKGLLLGISTTTLVFFFISSGIFDYSSNKISFIESDNRRKAETNPFGALEWESRMLRDPATGRIPEGIRAMELAQAKQIQEANLALVPNGILANTYNFLGPGNYGGRTRAIKYDVRFNGTSNKVILAGGVSGGVYKSTDNGTSWVRKSPTDQLYSVTSIAQDTRPTHQDTWYYTTGEAIGNSATDIGSSAFYLGNGVYKSTDNGETWTRLSNSNTGALETLDRREDLLTKVIVDPTNGNVYMAALDGIFRSADAGSSWSNVLNSGAGSLSTAMVTDIVVTSTGILYAAFSGINNTSPNDMPGVWTSTTGNPGSWTKIAGNGAATNPVDWRANGGYGRVVLAIPPNAEDTLYALYYNNIENSTCTPEGSPEADLFRWRQSTTTWTNLSANLPDEPGCSVGNDPFAVQEGYDLVLATKPDNQNVLFIGGTNIYRSTDGFTSTSNTTRIGGYADPTSYGPYTNSHADIHSVEFQPGSPGIMLCGNDGGIQRTSDDLAITIIWTDISTNYSTYQYYHVAIDPRTGNTKVMGGAQDNGTTRSTGVGTNFEKIVSGDGVSVGLSNVFSGNTYEYAGAQSGLIVRRNSTDAPDSYDDITPNSLSGGEFVTVFQLDPDNTENLYYAFTNSIYRSTTASTVAFNTWTRMTGVEASVGGGNDVTAMATTRGAYSALTASLFFGTANGKVFRLDDPANVSAATAPVDITGGGFPANSYVSSISVNPNNDDTVIVTFSNYNVISVWWTGNANAATPTWQNVEGNLTLPSFRSSTIAITNNGAEYFVGTSVGLFRASINGASPGTTNWVQESPSGIGNAVVSHIALRPADNQMAVGTHGYGMWGTQLALLPVNFTSFTGVVEKTHNKLLWKVENEVNNQGYEVQRKYSNDQGFSKVGFVNATNSTSKSNSYSYNDVFVDLGKENVSYRLKQIDIDGNFTYSPIVNLTRKASSKFIEYVSLNKDKLTIRVNAGNNRQSLVLRLFDISGRLLKQTRIAYQSQQIDISTLAHGMLLINISDDTGQKYSEKLIH